jgi:hypothetical protein
MARTREGSGPAAVNSVIPAQSHAFRIWILIV